MSFNKVILMGIVSKTPEKRIGKSGLHYYDFDVAINEKSKEDGRTYSTFVHCTAWSSIGKAISEHVDKGGRIFIEGKVSAMKVNGENVNSILVQNVQFLSPSKKNKSEEDKPREIESDDFIPF